MPTASSTYQYRVLFKDSFGYQSSTVDFTVTTGVGETRILLTNLPTISDDITGLSRVIYRTAADGSTFKFLLEDNGKTKGKADNTADGSLGSDYAANGTTTGGSIIVYSEIGKPTSIPALNYLLVYPDDGDVITGTVDDGIRILIFKKNSIRQVFTNGSPQNWNIETLTEKIGCDTPISIKKTKDKIYFASHKQIYRYPDYLDVPISQSKVDTFNSATSIDDAGYITSKGWYCVILTVSSSKYLMIYDEKTEAWYTFKADNYDLWYSVIEKEFGTSRGTILVGTYSYVVKYSTTKLDYSDPTHFEAMTAVLKTKTFTSSDATNDFRLRKYFSDYKKTDDVNVTHTFTDPQTAGTLVYNDTTNSAISSDYKNWIQPTDQMTGSLRVVNKINYKISGWDEFNAFRLKARPVNHGRK